MVRQKGFRGLAIYQEVVRAFPAITPAIENDFTSLPLSNATVLWSERVEKSAAKVQAVRVQLQVQNQQGRDWYLHPLYPPWPSGSPDPYPVPTSARPFLPALPRPLLPRNSQLRTKTQLHILRTVDFAKESTRTTHFRIFMRLSSMLPRLKGYEKDSKTQNNCS